MHYFLIAGEASGDLHAADLIRELRNTDPAANFTFLGGDKMEQEAAAKPIIHYSEMAYMGFIDVLKNIKKVRSNLATAKDALEVAQPDALILIDYPSFNLKIAEKAASLGIPVYYFIPPKVWAWKKWRIGAIRRLVRRVFAIFPFEPEFYARNGAKAYYVGNPSVAQVDARLAALPPRQEFIDRYHLRARRDYLALMPGSRLSEIRNNLAVMHLAAQQFPQYHCLIIAAPGVPDQYYRDNGAGLIPILRPDSAVDVLAQCHAALVTSGTATLECALAGTPQVVCYRGTGSRLTYDVMKRVLSIPFVSLPNLIAGKEVVPEMLMHQCSPAPVAAALEPLLPNNSPQRQQQLDGYALIRAKLGTKNAARTTAHAIFADLHKLKSNNC